MELLDLFSDFITGNVRQRLVSSILDHHHPAPNGFKTNIKSPILFEAGYVSRWSYRYGQTVPSDRPSRCKCVLAEVRACSGNDQIAVCSRTKAATANVAIQYLKWKLPKTCPIQELGSEEMMLYNYSHWYYTIYYIPSNLYYSIKRPARNLFFVKYSDCNFKSLRPGVLDIEICINTVFSRFHDFDRHFEFIRNLTVS